MIRRFSGQEAKKVSSTYYPERVYDEVLGLAQKELGLGPYPSWDFLVVKMGTRTVGFWVPRIGMAEYQLGDVYVAAVTLGYGLTRLVIERETSTGGESLLPRLADLMDLLSAGHLSETEAKQVMDRLAP